MFSLNTHISERSFYALKALQTRVFGQPWDGAPLLKHVQGRLRYLKDEGLIDYVFNAQTGGGMDETRSGYFLTDDGRYEYRRALKRLRMAVDEPAPPPVLVARKATGKKVS